jgi:hypothetical protein
MQPMHYLVAHYTENDVRAATLPVILIKDDGSMMVLFQNRLWPVFSAIPTMKLELIEIVPQADAVEKYYKKPARVKPEAKIEAKPQVETKPQEVK